MAVPENAPDGGAVLGNGEVVQLAGIGARLGARVIDFIVGLVILFALGFAGLIGDFTSVDGSA
jgi:hypothetical protein